MSDMNELDKRLIADAALSRYATGSDKSFCEAYEFAEKDEFHSFEEASDWIEQHIRTIDWVFNHLQEIVTDAVHTHVIAFDDDVRTEEGLGHGTEGMTDSEV